MSTPWQNARVSERILVWGCLLWISSASELGVILKAGDTEIASFIEAVRFHSDTPSEIAVGASRVQSAFDKARQRLANEKHGESWIRFLQMDQIQECLSKLASSNVQTDRFSQGQNESSEESEKQLDFLNTAVHRFYGLAPGLEMKELLHLRQQLDEYIWQLRRNLNADKFQSEFKRRLLATRAVIESTWNPHEKFSRLEPQLRWLNRHGRAVGISSHWNKQKNPNLVFRVTSKGLNEWGQQSINRTVPFDQQVNGRQVRGEATLTGNGSLQPLESPERFSAEYSLDAYVDVVFSGSQGRLYFDIGSSASANCRQVISLIDERMIQFPPQVRVSANLNSATICTQRNGLIPRLIRRGGVRAIRNQQSEIEDGVAHSIADSIAEEFTQEISKRVNELEHEFVEQVRLRLQRLGISLDDFASSSTSTGASFHAVVGGDLGLSAPNFPPFVQSIGLAQVQVHQSLLNALFHQLFAGREISDLRRTLSGIGIAFQDAGQGKELVGITFSEDSPVTVNLKCAGSRCMLELRMSGTSYRFDQYKLSAMDFIVRFWMRNESGRTLLIREEPVEVLPPPGGSSLRFIQQRQLVSSRLQAFFPERQQFDIHKLIAEVDDSGILGDLQMTATDGWFTFQL